MPTTTPLERRDIPPQLSETLEHIVGQLDVITQVQLYLRCRSTWGVALQVLFKQCNINSVALGC